MTSNQDSQNYQNLETEAQGQNTNWLHHINDAIVVEECAQGLHPEAFCNLLQP